MQEHGVALAAEEAHEEPDTGGASSSQTACEALLPGLQAQRSWEHYKWMGHTSNAMLSALAIASMLRWRHFMLHALKGTHQ